MEHVIKLSWSNIEKLRQCPKQFYHARVVRDVPRQPQHPAAALGEKVHNTIQTAVTEKKPTTYPIVEALRQAVRGTLTIEAGMAVTKGLVPCEPKSKQAWFTGYMDLLWLSGSTAYIADLKNGQRKYNIGSEQLKTYAALTFLSRPEVQKVNTAYVWLKTDELDLDTYDRSQLTETLKPILDTERALENYQTMKHWPARPGPLCRFCPLESRQCAHRVG